MQFSNLMKWTAAPILAFALMTAGCTKKEETAAVDPAAQAEADKKLADAQAQLDQAQKDLEAAKQKAEQATAAAQSATAAARKTTAAKTAPAGASGWSQGQTPAAAKAPAAPVKPREFTLPAGSNVVVRTTSAISTKTMNSGDAFEGTLNQPLEVDGYVIAGKGATVRGQVTESDPGGRVKGVATIAVRLNSVTTASGETVALKTDAIGKEAPQSKKKDALKVGIASGVGAAIGAIAGGGRGAAIGAGAGAAGGTGVVMATRGEPAVIPAESLLTFRTTAPVTVTEKR